MDIKNVQKQKGFTLVEIAIVLVIIGLLLGGVLKGQELIENTKLKAIKTDSDAISSAVLGYQDRFRALPGDDTAAISRGATAAGDGDGLIEAAEVAGVWESLRDAGFMSGSGATLPVNSFGGNIAILSGTSGVVLCHAGVSAEQMELIDTRYDDGTGTGNAGAATGAINYALATGGTALTVLTSSLGVVVAAGQFCIGY